jgi:hypothetical protein
LSAIDREATFFSKYNLSTVAVTGGNLSNLIESTVTDTTCKDPFKAKAAKDAGKDFAMYYVIEADVNQGLTGWRSSTLSSPSALLPPFQMYHHLSGTKECASSPGVIHVAYVISYLQQVTRERERERGG